jgi:glycosyltransferase involved in cell wall biosynthesis
MTNDVLLPGFVPDDELPLWYRAADAFVYPSQYEGFGMPPLEALASRTPVITSNVSSMPEAVGGAALLVDPKSVEQLTDALIRVTTDEPLRESLRALGLERARHFTWKHAAEVTAGAYRRALGMPGTLTALNTVA